MTDQIGWITIKLANRQESQEADYQCSLVKGLWEEVIGLPLPKAYPYVDYSKNELRVPVIRRVIVALAARLDNSADIAEDNILHLKQWINKKYPSAMTKTEIEGHKWRKAFCLKLKRAVIAAAKKKVK